MNRVIACVADVHIGNHRQFGGPLIAGVNTRCRENLDTLAAAYQIAHDHDAAHMFILGDLFDAAKQPPPVIAATMEVLHRGALPTTIITGNHDQFSTAPGDHACAPLDFLSNVTVEDQPCVRTIAGYTVALLPYQPGEAGAWVPRTLRDLMNRARRERGDIADPVDYALGHAPFEPTAREFSGSGVRGLALSHFARDFVFGHLHAHGRHRAGTLCPTGWGDLNCVGRVYISVGPESVPAYVSVPCAPTWIDCDPALAPPLMHVSENRRTTRVRTRASVDPLALAEMRATFADVVVRPDGTSKTLLASAVHSVRAASTATEAVERYVSGLGLDAPTAERVIQACRHLLAAKPADVAR